MLQLPEPLLTFRLYSDLVRLARDDAESAQDDAARDARDSRVLHRLRALVMLLPQANFRTCGMLVHHLHRCVRVRSRVNSSVG